MKRFGLLVVLAITGLVGERAAPAHVAPSVDDNNRYIKLTPQGDRLRLSYTVFFGQVPGAGMRPSMDANHDKQIDDAEAQAYGQKLAAEVAASIDLDVDGHTVPVVWETIAVGMGTPTVAAGAFSVDLVAYPCTAGRGKHAVLLHDRFKLLRPGETEVHVEDGPGIAVEHARIGQTDDPSHDYRFAGPAAPMTDDGLDLAYVVTDKAPLSGACKQAPKSGSSTTVVVIALIGALVAAAAGALWFRAKRR